MTRTMWRGVGLVTAGIVFQAWWLGLPGVFLSVGLAVSLLLWLTTGWRIRPPVRAVFLLGLLVFVGHVAEEYLTGFPAAVPALFGRSPWTDARFLVFNGVFLIVFAVAAVSLRPGRDLAALVALFFAVVGGVGNGVVHLLLVVDRGGYFPGAWTAPFCLVVGIAMLGALYRSPSPDPG